MIMVSACLFGVDCKYNGKNNYNAEICRALENEQVVFFCPEQSGGLSSPRPACEIQGGDGLGVLEGTARVMDQHGQDLTDAFISGARNTLRMAKTLGPDLIILKSRSPSCGVGLIYDGAFNLKTRAGDGVTSALLKQNGFRVMNDEEYLSGRS